MALALRVIGQKQTSGEPQLVAAVRQGDDRAFEELFSRYRSRITAYVLGMVGGDHGKAEDITQEVFLSALRRLRDTERPIAFKPWIYEIAKNACIDEFRRSRRSSEISLNADDDSPSGDGNLVSKQPTPDAAMENKQRLEALRGAFRGLPENQHRILVMRELEGRSYREIAGRMGMTRPMVESTLFRARRRLGEEYEELTSGRRCEQVCEVVDRADASSIRVLGIRARRQVALHLSHCDDCRRYARLAGADESLFQAPTFADKVAALFPFGLLGRRLFGPGRRAHALMARKASVASQFMGPIGSSAILGRVAAAVLVIAAAGGTYEGVRLTTGTSSAHNAAAVVAGKAVRGQASSTQASSTQGSRAPGSALRATASGSAASLKTTLGSANPAVPAKGQHGGGKATPATHPGAPTSTSSTGPGSSTSAASSTSSAGAHHGLLGSGTSKGALGGLLPHLHSPNGGLPALKLPSPKSVLQSTGQTASQTAKSVGQAAGQAAGQAGSAAGKAVSAAGQAVNGAGQAVGGVVNGAGQAVSGAGQAVNGATQAINTITGLGH